MLKTLAIGNYRSLLDLAIPLDSLNVITGPNGSGKSNVYRALRLLAETATGGVINSIAREGGLQSTFWAGPEDVSERKKRGAVAIQGTHRKEGPARLRLGFCRDDFGHAISLGLPPPPGPDNPEPSAFSLDPEIKRECIWAGGSYRPATSLVAALESHPQCNSIQLEINLGQMEVVGQRMLDRPSWHWPD